MSYVRNSGVNYSQKSGEGLCLCKERHRGHAKLRNTYMDWLNMWGHEEGERLEFSLLVLAALFFMISVEHNKIEGQVAWLFYEKGKY
jgi:hypothetical protein